MERIHRDNQNMNGNIVRLSLTNRQVIEIVQGMAGNAMERASHDNAAAIWALECKMTM